MPCYPIFAASGNEVIDRGIAVYFPAPHSYTGEDVLELQGHGGIVVMQLLLKRCLELGARIAEPGEFTRRAYLNDKLDLAQAEAVADLIDASTAQAARYALRSLQGAFSVRINEFIRELTELRALIEAVLDFPEEEIDFVKQVDVRRAAYWPARTAASGSGCIKTRKAAAGRYARGARRATQRREIELAQSAGGGRSRYRDGHPGDDSRCDKTQRRHARCARTYHRYRGVAGVSMTQSSRSGSLAPGRR